ncbi:hypothetical protein V5O48_016906 [Marasmius crinis-equi]|uniref:Uncharacterized protein n=1 Tax=Marasmius crinis-equi TaxID=585013 RepID=A0ABR3EQP2_9AGAR
MNDIQYQHECEIAKEYFGLLHPVHSKMPGGNAIALALFTRLLLRLSGQLFQILSLGQQERIQRLLDLQQPIRLTLPNNDSEATRERDHRLYALLRVLPERLDHSVAELSEDLCLYYAQKRIDGLSEFKLQIPQGPLSEEQRALLCENPIIADMHCVLVCIGLEEQDEDSEDLPEDADLEYLAQDDNAVPDSNSSFHVWPVFDPSILMENTRPFAKLDMHEELAEVLHWQASEDDDVSDEESQQRRTPSRFFAEYLPAPLLEELKAIASSGKPTGPAEQFLLEKALAALSRRELVRRMNLERSEALMKGSDPDLPASGTWTETVYTRDRLWNGDTAGITNLDVLLTQAKLNKLIDEIKDTFNISHSG